MVWKLYPASGWNSWYTALCCAAIDAIGALQQLQTCHMCLAFRTTSHLIWAQKQQSVLLKSKWASRWYRLFLKQDNISRPTAPNMIPILQAHSQMKEKQWSDFKKNMYSHSFGGGWGAGQNITLCFSDFARSFICHQLWWRLLNYSLASQLNCGESKMAKNKHPAICSFGQSLHDSFYFQRCNSNLINHERLPRPPWIVVETFHFHWDQSMLLPIVPIEILLSIVW